MLWTGVVAPWYFFPMYNGMAVASMPAVEIDDKVMRLEGDRRFVNRPYVG